MHKLKTLLTFDSKLSSQIQIKIFTQIFRVKVIDNTNYFFY